jgi:hypothetical protein
MVLFIIIVENAFNEKIVETALVKGPCGECQVGGAPGKLWITGKIGPDFVYDCRECF